MCVCVCVCVCVCACVRERARSGGVSSDSATIKDAVFANLDSKYLPRCISIVKPNRRKIFRVY